jgi:hypothetical protein
MEPRRRADRLRRPGAVGLVEEGEDWLRLHWLLVHFGRQERLGPGERRQTQDEHAIEIRRAYGYREFAEAAGELRES